MKFCRNVIIFNVSFAISDTSPVMDMLNHNSRPSSRASPDNLSAGDSKSPNNLEGRPSQRYAQFLQFEFYQIYKGLLISERNFGLFKSPKKTNQNFEGFKYALVSKMGKINKIN